MNSTNHVRVVWLLPSAFFYWQPALSEFTRLFPETIVFTGRFHGYAPGFENSLNIKEVGKRKIIELNQSATGYSPSFTYLSPSIIGQLFSFKPNVIFSSSFGIWTILAILFKFLGNWQVVIAYEGSSPGVDFRNSPLRLVIRRIMLKLADACITNSQAGKDYLLEYLQADPKRTFVQPYEIPAVGALFGKQQQAAICLQDLPKPVFLFVGGVIPRKGLQLLLQACIFLKEHDCQDYTLLIVGDGAQRQELQSFIESNDLQNFVKWTGRVDYDNLGQYFQAADVFVLPTLEDTWGVVVLEAMLLGKPILCSKWAGTSEIIADGRNGYVFDPYQPEQLAALMKQFIDDPSLIDRMGEHSKQIMSNFTPELASKTLAEVVKCISA